MKPGDMVSTYTAARTLGVHRKTIYALIDQGHLRAVKIGRLLRIRREDVDRVATEGTVKRHAARS